MSSEACNLEGMTPAYVNVYAGRVAVVKGKFNRTRIQITSEDGIATLDTKQALRLLAWLQAWVDMGRPPEPGNGWPE